MFKVTVAHIKSQYPRCTREKAQPNISASAVQVYPLSEPTGCGISRGDMSVWMRGRPKKSAEWAPQNQL